MGATPLDLPVLSDGVVCLRPFALSDATALTKIWRDPAIRARNEVPEPSEDAAREWVARIATRADSGRTWEWAIVDSASDALAGRRALKEIDWNQKQAVAASWIGPTFRGKRLAARSLRLAATYAFAQGLTRIHAECETDNEAAFRSMMAAGMRLEGTLHAVSLAGEAVDVHVLEMLPGDLAGARPL
jgi:ribosomal-protein-alanine N-acetyltransferase